MSTKKRLLDFVCAYVPLVYFFLVANVVLLLLTLYSIGFGSQRADNWTLNRFNLAITGTNIVVTTYVAYRCSNRR